MAETRQSLSPGATEQAQLWSARARDWAEVMEGWDGWGVPAYRHVLERVPAAPGTRVLDVGCGAGRFLRMAADRGMATAGLDATAALVEIARERIVDADLRVGDMEKLPWDDDSFDIVTGFNSFFIAPDMTAALSEARRVAAPGGVVAMTVFGRPDRCQSTAMFRAVGRLMSSEEEVRDEDGDEPAPALYEEGTLETLAGRAGLSTKDAGYLAFEETYPDVETLLRGVMAAPPMVRAGQAVGDDEVRDTLAALFDGWRAADGSCRLSEEVRYLIARA